MKIDLTITISVILALVAIISNMLTAVINNAHDSKMKKLELKHEQLQTIIHHRNTISCLFYTFPVIYILKCQKPTIS